MNTTMDKLFKGYSLKEIEEILLKSTVKDLKKGNQASLFTISKNERIIIPNLKM